MKLFPLCTTTAVLALAACLTHAGIAKSREVLIYSSRFNKADNQIYQIFSKDTGIKVRLINAKGSSIVERIKQQGSSARADVIILVESEQIINATNAGLFQPNPSANLERQVPSSDIDPQRRWYNLSHGNTHAKISAAGLAKYAKNKEEGIQLLEYLASPYGRLLSDGISLDEITEAKKRQSSGNCPPGKRQYQKTVLFGLIKGQKLCLSDYEAESLSSQQRRDVQSTLNNIETQRKLDNIEANSFRPNLVTCNSSGFGSYVSVTCY